MPSSAAWDHSPTRLAWARRIVWEIGELIAWLAIFLAYVSAPAYSTPGWIMGVGAVLMLYVLYRILIQLKDNIPGALRMVRVLQQYPWQIVEGLPRGLGKHPEAQDDGMWFELRNPERMDERIPLVFIKHHRSRWWMKRIGGPRTDPSLKSQIEPLWFAGDPRFLAVVAAPGRNPKSPKRLHFLYQRPAFVKLVAPQSWDASPEDLERARRAGARVPNPVSQPRPN